MKNPVGLDESSRLRLREEASARVVPERLAELVAAMTDIPSPTGEEAPLARLIASLLAEGGLQARVQALDEQQANAVGSLAGS
ncbi:MAG: deacylase, partial [Acidimicrobiaceae bacterium]|nr:deacylase [Acidimicrobiaceae bacterium]